MVATGLVAIPVADLALVHNQVRNAIFPWLAYWLWGDSGVVLPIGTVAGPYDVRPLEVMLGLPMSGSFAALALTHDQRLWVYTEGRWMTIHLADLDETGTASLITGIHDVVAPIAARDIYDEEGPKESRSDYAYIVQLIVYELKRLSKLIATPAQ